MNYFLKTFPRERPKLKTQVLLLLIHKYALFGELKPTL